MVNRKLLDNMSKIMQSDYKSAVKTAIQNRKCPFFKFRNVLSRRSSSQNYQPQQPQQKRNYVAYRTREPTHAGPSDQGKEHNECKQLGEISPTKTKTALTFRSTSLRAQSKE